MKKWVMLEIAVCVDTNLEDVNGIVDNLDIEINGNHTARVCEYNIENSYEFDC